MTISESDYQKLEAPPVDGTHEPEPNKVPGRINVVSEEIKAATEEDLRRIIEQEGRMREPEIATEESGGAVGAESYIDDHPTNFYWTDGVARLVNRIQAQFPWETYANTYYWHPPYAPPDITVQYDAVSVDFWGGGLWNGEYVGYRGKPIGTDLGHQVWNALWNDGYLPNISWIIWNGRWWLRNRDPSWSDAPWGPPDSDAGHYNHIHVTYEW